MKVADCLKVFFVEECAHRRVIMETMRNDTPKDFKELMYEGAAFLRFVYDQNVRHLENKIKYLQDELKSTLRNSRKRKQSPLDASSTSSRGKKFQRKNNPDGKEVYEVHRILACKTDINGSRYYLIQWKGYPSDQNSWVNDTDMNAQESIQDFWDDVSMARSKLQCQAGRERIL